VVSSPIDVNSVFEFIAFLTLGLLKHLLVFGLRSSASNRPRNGSNNTAGHDENGIVLSSDTAHPLSSEATAYMGPFAVPGWFDLVCADDPSSTSIAYKYNNKIRVSGGGLGVVL
jgi:hypothetical protein